MSRTLQELVYLSYLYDTLTPTNMYLDKNQVKGFIKLYLLATLGDKRESPLSIDKYGQRITLKYKIHA